MLDRIVSEFNSRRYFAILSLHSLELKTSKISLVYGNNA